MLKTFISICPNKVKNYNAIYLRKKEEIYSYIYVFEKLTGRCLRGGMLKAMDCGIVVSEFVLQSRYYIHFRANTLGKGMNPLILPAMG